MKLRPLLLAAALCAAPPLAAQTAPQASPVDRIIDEGANRSQVMLTAQHLTDVIGPRLTNSPQMRAAEEWTAAKFREWGLKNVRKEGFPFGRGWSIERSSVRMVSPRPLQLTAIPIAWTPAGNVTAPIVVAPMKRERDFDRYRGQLRGKIVLVSQPGTGSEPKEPAFQRLTDAEIGKLDEFEQPRFDPEQLARALRDEAFAAKRDAFLKAEGAVALATISYRDGKLLHGEGYQFETGGSPTLPAVQLAAEDYRRLARLAKTGPAPTLEIVSDVRYHDEDPNAYNVIAEIPGTDRQAGYVMAGAHLDSWVAGDGAADNAAGSAMIMEAARILVATGARPRRTIRFALWNGEEQGLLGSYAYVDKYLAKRGAPGSPPLRGVNTYYAFGSAWPITPLPGYRDLAAYFNIDNGSGKLRGLYAEGNPGAASTFREWLAPLSSMSAGSVVMSRTGGTDHLFLQQIGLPGFQFVQDPLDYETRVHHSSADTFDHLKADDMRQGSIVLAHVLLSAANAKDPLPRPPLPTKPVVTDPFAYPEADD
jgi:hypothetical protein